MIKINMFENLFNHNLLIYKVKISEQNYNLM